MKYEAVLGCQWGDEGKGKLIDSLAKNFDVVARCTGGANAGHTIVVNDKKYVFHLLPSGILNPKAECVIGNGCVICIETLIGELDSLEGIDYQSRLFISDRAFVVLPIHKYLDSNNESKLGNKKIGTTKRGIGPSYTDKIARRSIRLADFFDTNIFDKIQDLYKFHLGSDYNQDHKNEIEDVIFKFDKVKRYVINLDQFLNDCYKLNKSILFEGANGALLDIDHGTYPYVTSSNPTIGGIATGFGFPANKLTDVFGVCKAYCTRVGEGPFPSELFDETKNHLVQVGKEFGSTTGRERRCGWLDLVSLKTAIQKNGITQINLTKLDVLRGLPYLKVLKNYYLDGLKINYLPTLNKDIKRLDFDFEMFPGFDVDISKIRNFNDLPVSLKSYVKYIQEFLGVKVSSIGVGADREDLIILDN